MHKKHKGLLQCYHYNKVLSFYISILAANLPNLDLLDFFFFFLKIIYLLVFLISRVDAAVSRLLINNIASYLHLSIFYFFESPFNFNIYRRILLSAIRPRSRVQIDESIDKEF
jgi:hypothetical protein